MEEQNVQIVEDEKVRQSKGLIEETVKRVLDTMEKTGKVVTDPRNDPAFKAWQDSIKSPMGVEVQKSGIVRPGISEIATSIVKSKQFRRWVEKGQVETSEAIMFPSFFAKTANLTSVSDIRDVLGTEYLQGIVEKPMRSLHIRDLMNVIPTSEGQIVFLRQTGFTNAAVAVAESTDPDSPSTYARSTIVNAKVTTGVKKIAHQMPFPYELMEDADGLAAQLESQMIGGMLNTEDAEILRGDGTGENLEGLMVNASCQTFSWSAGTAGDNQADAILEGIVLVWIAELAADGIVMTPANAKSIMKLKTTTNEYLFPQFGNGMLGSLWGLPVVITTAQASNTVSIGAWRTAAVIRDREEASVVFTDTVASDMIQGLKRAIGRERLALVNYRPEAFVKVTLDSAPAGS